MRHCLFDNRARCADVYTNEATTLLTKCRAIVHANASLVGPEVDHFGVLQTHLAAIEPHQERTLLFVVTNFGAVLFEELTYVVDVGGDVLHHLVEPLFTLVVSYFESRRTEDVTKELGMTLLYHNHDFEFEKIDGKYALEVLYDTVPADLLQTELDTCWVRVGGEEPAAYVRKFSGRAPVVHLKDYAGGKSEHMYELIGIESEDAKPEENPFEFRPVGFGVQDMPAIIKASEDAGAEWLVVEQDQPSMGLDPMQCAEKAIGYLRSL